MTTEGYDRAAQILRRLVEPQPPSATLRPKLVMLGNCQMTFMAYLIRAYAPGLEVINRLARTSDSFEANMALAADATVVVAQIVPFDSSMADCLAAALSQPVVRAPNVMLTYLWPFLGNGTGRAEAAWRPYSPISLLNTNTADRRMVELVAAADTVEAARSAYGSLDIPSEIRIDRIRGLNVAQVETVCRAAGATLDRLFADHPNDQRAFHNFGHPAGPITAALFEHVLAAISERAPEVAALIDADAVRAAIAGTYGMHLKIIQSPVHPSVAAHFGLTWPDRPDLVHPDFGIMDMERYLDVIVETEFLFKLAGEPERPAGQTIAAIERHPFKTAVFDAAATQLWTNGAHEAAMAILQSQADHVGVMSMAAVNEKARRMARRFPQGARWMLDTQRAGELTSDDPEVIKANGTLSDRITQVTERRERKDVRQARRLARAEQGEKAALSKAERQARRRARRKT